MYVAPKFIFYIRFNSIHRLPLSLTPLQPKKRPFWFNMHVAKVVNKLDEVQAYGRMSLWLNMSVQFNILAKSGVRIRASQTMSFNLFLKDCCFWMSYGKCLSLVKVIWPCLHLSRAQGESFSILFKVVVRAYCGEWLVWDYLCDWCFECVHVCLLIL